MVCTFVCSASFVVGRAHRLILEKASSHRPNISLKCCQAVFVVRHLLIHLYTLTETRLSVVMHDVATDFSHFFVLKQIADLHTLLPG